MGPTFADYVAWEQGPQAHGKRESEKGWWLDCFAEAPDQLELPYDLDCPPRLSFEGEELSVDLPPEISRPLLELAKAGSITPRNVFLAAWGLVLSRLGNNPDLVLGIPTSGRHVNGTEDIVGMFVNTVPVRMKLVADESFRGFCARLARETAEAFERQSYQLNDLVVDLGLVRNPSRNPLFDILLVWQDELGKAKSSTLGLSELGAAVTPAKFDSELTVENGPEGQRLVLVFSTKLFKRSTAEKFMAHLRRILEQAAQNPDMPMRDFRMLQPWEREMLLGDFNRSDGPAVEAATLVDSLREAGSRAAHRARGGGPRWRLHLPGGRPAGHVPREAARLEGRRLGRRGGPGDAAVAAPAGGHRRNLEGGGGLSAHRTRCPRGARGRHARGCRRPRAGLRRGDVRTGAGEGRPMGWNRLERSGRAAFAGPAAVDRLRHLHVRLHRQAERRGHRAPERGELRRLLGADLRDWPRRFACCSSRRSPSMRPWSRLASRWPVGRVWSCRPRLRCLISRPSRNSSRRGE